MTLVAAIELHGVPVLIGDVLITGKTPKTKPISIPTLTPNQLKQLNTENPVMTLRRKVLQINEKLVIGWTGYEKEAEVVFEDIYHEFSSKNTSRSEFFQFLENFDKDFDPRWCKVVGWIADEEGVISFFWDTVSKNVLTDDSFILGSGASDFSEALDGHRWLHNYEAIHSPQNLAIKTALSHAGNMIAQELLTGLSISKGYGGGIEILYYDGKQFQAVDDVTFIFSTAKIDIDKHSIELSPMPLILKPKYVEDVLILKSSRLAPDKEYPGVMAIQKQEFYYILPVHKDGIDFDPNHHIFTSNHSENYCFFCHVSTDTINISQCFVGKNSPEMQLMDFEKIHANGIEEAFTINEALLPSLIYRNVAPIILQVSNSDYGAAMIQLNSGNYDKAAEYFNDVIHSKPEHFDALLMRGDVYYSIGSIEQAISDFTTAIESNDKHPLLADTYLKRAQAHIDLSNFEKAKEDYEFVLRLNPTHLNIKAIKQKFAINFGQWALQLYLQDKYHQALSLYNKSIKIDENNHFFYINRGEVYFAQGNYRKALKDFKHAAKSEPDNQLITANLAITFFALDNTQEAKNLWGILVETDNSFLDIDWVKQQLQWVDPLCEAAKQIISLF